MNIKYGIQYVYQCSRYTYKYFGLKILSDYGNNNDETLYVWSFFLATLYVLRG